MERKGGRKRGSGAGSHQALSPALPHEVMGLCEQEPQEIHQPVRPPWPEPWLTGVELSRLYVGAALSSELEDLESVPTLVPSSWVAQSRPPAFPGVSVDYLRSGLNLNIEICMGQKVCFRVRVTEGAGQALPAPGRHPHRHEKTPGGGGAEAQAGARWAARAKPPPLRAAVPASGEGGHRRWLRMCMGGRPLGGTGTGRACAGRWRGGCRDKRPMETGHSGFPSSADWS